MDFYDRFRVASGQRLRLSPADPDFKARHTTAKAAKAETEQWHQRLTRQQSLLYADQRHSLLIVLQGMDAAGKDGTISQVFSALNPRAARVVSFRQPSEAELAHDFLWRVHPHVPAKGEVAIFNRSPYEDVLVPLVHEQIDKATWKWRLEEIVAFEALLSASGTAVLKFFLHISRKEQLARFAERLEDPAHNWKIAESDYAERAFWEQYQAVYEEVLPETSSQAAPWFVIPANHKWFRNLAVSAIVVQALEALDLRYPPPRVDLARIRREYHAAVEAARRGPA